MQVNAKSGKNVLLVLNENSEYTSSPFSSDNYC